MFDISPLQIVIVLAIVVVFGPKGLPEFGRGLGRGIRTFKEGISGNDVPRQNAARVEAAAATDERNSR